MWIDYGRLFYVAVVCCLLAVFPQNSRAADGDIVNHQTTIINLNIQNSSLVDVLRSLDKQSGFTTSLKGPYKPVEIYTINFKKLSADHALKAILKNYDYFITDDVKGRVIHLYGLSAQNTLQQTMVLTGDQNNEDTSNSVTEVQELVYHPDESELSDNPGELSIIDGTNILEFVYHPETLYTPDVPYTYEYNEDGILEPIPQPTVNLNSQNGEISFLDDSGIMEYISYPDEIYAPEDKTYTLNYTDEGILELVVNSSSTK